ncbi:MAG: glutamate transport system permease protein [Actinomycetota bacterium]|nr:glutamate transport system permease protein [Actinomycetota bacterium]
MDAITDNLSLFAGGYRTSLLIALLGLVGSLLVGTAVTALRVSPLAPLRAAGAGWVHLLRNCPLTVVLFFMAFGLPEIGVNGSYYVFGVSALVVYTSAFVCEALRSGINAVPQGQAEAARALGLSFTQTLGTVILPQAFRTSIPPLGSVLIAMFKNSAIIGAFGVSGDLFDVGEALTSARGYAVLPVLTGVAVGYLGITVPVAAIMAALERKVAIYR